MNYVPHQMRIKEWEKKHCNYPQILMCDKKNVMRFCGPDLMYVISSDDPVQLKIQPSLLQFSKKIFLHKTISMSICMMALAMTASTQTASPHSWI